MMGKDANSWVGADQDGIVVIGAGAVGCATATYIAEQGRDVAIWSPTGKRLSIVNEKEVEFTVTRQAGNKLVRVQGLIGKDEIRKYPTVIVCLPATAYRTVFEDIVEHLVSGQTVIISGALSLSPVWLYELGRRHGVELCVVGWGTTLTTAHFLADGVLYMNSPRDVIPMFPVGTKDNGKLAYELCVNIFGRRFLLTATLLEATLSNINPIAHAAEVIPNLTRMEKAEDWPLFGNFLSAGARLASALDDERLAIASAFDIRLRTLAEHYRNSYHVEGNTLADVVAQIESTGQGPSGPTTIMHRYILEDMPFGLAVFEKLAQACNVSVPAISACLTLLNIFYSQDFRKSNDLILDLDFDTLSDYKLSL
ncbi:NAD/NADP octopine/nopaline dehydrogenase family protein [Pusillimonas sp. ANT_WB101]|uniref:NAD/NADP octopine/nopaline dehydrogenase family protein n=1 Tax=Pusillimonas sp. ANT_WB101 TaxID=2597356 RepID=UPI00165D6E3C|nr:NAD/NADP octopine/nopaline dehydrogenase family protein [Pusillimonas sp. ANT_WB101]